MNTHLHTVAEECKKQFVTRFISTATVVLMLDLTNSSNKDGPLKDAWKDCADLDEKLRKTTRRILLICRAVGGDDYKVLKVIKKVMTAPDYNKVGSIIRDYPLEGRVVIFGIGIATICITCGYISIYSY